MESSTKKQKINPVSQSDNQHYDEMLEIVKKYWIKGKNGDLKELVNNKVYDKLNLKKGYFTNKVSKVRTRDVIDHKLLLVMFEQIKPRKTAIEQATLDSAQISMQRMSD